MECILMNFDDRIRIVHDVSNTPVALSIGETKPADLHPTIIEFLKKSMTKTHDPLVILDDEARVMSTEIKQVMDILANIYTAPYEESLARTIAILGAENVGGPAPARDELRYRLREVAAAFAQKPNADKETIVEKAKEIAKKSDKSKTDVNTQDDVDPEVLDAALARQRRAAARKEQNEEVLETLPSMAPTLRDKMDAALGIEIGADVRGLADALTPADDEDFDASKSRPEPGKRKRPAKKAGKAKKAPTASAAKASAKQKAGKPAKKPLGRVRA